MLPQATKPVSTPGDVTDRAGIVRVLCTAKRYDSIVTLRLDDNAGTLVRGKVHDVVPRRSVWIISAAPVGCHPQVSDVVVLLDHVASIHVDAR